MVLYRGELFENSEQLRLIESLKGDVYRTLKEVPYPTYDTVINACDKLYQKVMNHEYDNIAIPLLNALNIPYSMLDKYAAYFSKEGLQKKVDTELGDLIEGPRKLDAHTLRECRPLGVLFHIAAGNVDLLPAYSVIEARFFTLYNDI